MSVAGLAGLGLAVLVLDPMTSGAPQNLTGVILLGSVGTLAAALGWYFHLRYLGGKGT